MLNRDLIFSCRRNGSELFLIPFNLRESSIVVAFKLE